ncbi:MAG: hypothetical protein ABUS57_12020 [Pseudomonadota bacterium]
MLGEALAYPFVLLFRRPVTVIGALLAGLVISALVDEGWRQLSALNLEAAAAFDPSFRLDPFYLSMQAVYYVVRSVAQSFPVALIFVAALRHLDFRDSGFRFADGARIGALTAAYVLLFVAPLQIMYPVMMRAWMSSPRTTNVFMLAPFIGLGAFAVQAVVLAIFFLSWPHTIARQKLRLFLTWKVGWRKALLAVVSLLLVLVATTFVNYAGSMANWTLFTATGLDRVSDQWRIRSLFQEWPRFLGVYFIDAASALIYARVAPPRPDRVADHF